jgi:thiamine-monophosphate kinase
VPKGTAILRSGAKAGDMIFVSGQLGGAAGGLRMLEQSFGETSGILIERQLRPVPRVALGKILLEKGIASAAIDISDGLSSDLLHICMASNVGARIETIPTNENLLEYFESDESIQFALHGGEDFELLFTVPPEKISSLENLPVSRIGEITSNTGIIELVRDGKTEILQPKGYRHF